MEDGDIADETEKQGFADVMVNQWTVGWRTAAFIILPYVLGKVWNLVSLDPILLRSNRYQSYLNRCCPRLLFQMAGRQKHR